MASDEWARVVRPPIFSALKPLGFRVRDRTWHRSDDRLTAVVQLAASRWGDDSGNLVLGYWLEAIEVSRHRPPLHECHVHVPIVTLFDDPWDSVDAALDFRFPRLSMEQRPTHIARAMDTVVVPFLESTRTVEGLAKNLDDRGLANKIFIHRHARALLEAPL